MRVLVAAIGRLGRGPEADGVRRFAERASDLARITSLGPVVVRELEDKGKGGAEAESALLLKAAGSARKIVLDERGEAPRSLGFAKKLERWRDQGTPEVAFLIGGADGHAPQLRDEADWLLSLGPMTWPHGLARLMLFEQIYRAASILAGHPYHREG